MEEKTVTTSMENISNIRQQILLLIKQAGKATTAELAEQLGVSYEAVRQQLKLLEGDNLVTRCVERNPDECRVGRPTSHYALSPAGDHLFPKNYDELAIELIDTMADTLGPEAMRQVLAALTDSRVKEWEPKVRDKSLEERIEVLKGIYLKDDPFMYADQSDNELRLVEGNCPFLNVASRRPALCSVTVSTLTKLLGRQVVREKRFQNGDGRCVFRVLTDRPIDPDNHSFDFEPEP